jgi:predicted RNA-binding Zn-ribbon protein involved in translation (DUF1610 family)
MKNDPGLFTDSTGDGMAGAMDVELGTQRELKETIYNGTRACKACGAGIDPVQSLRNMELCPTCNRRKMNRLVKGRMA